MKKRSMLFTALALVLVAAISIGGTLAYFSASATATNTITFGNVKIEVVEENWNKAGGSDVASHVTPGQTFNKDPKVRNIGGNPCYVRIERPDFIIATKDRWGNYTFTSTLFEITGLNVGGDSDEWTYGGDDYFYYNSIVTTTGNTATTSTLFTALKLKKNVVNKIENAPALAGGGPNPPAPIELTVDKIDITISAEAVQSEGNITSGQNGSPDAVKAFRALNSND